MSAKSIVLIFLLIRTVGVNCKILSESERANRAAFIQKLLNKEKELEGRLRLVGGPDKFEGKNYSLGFINECENSKLKLSWYLI